MKGKMMKKSFICLSALLLVGCLQADTFFSLEKVPSSLNATILPHQDIDLMLEENSATGYAWRAFYDARLCSVSIEHKRPEYGTQDGAGGYAKIEIEPVAAAPFLVTLSYVRADQQNPVPLKTMKIHVSVSANGVPVAKHLVPPSAPAVHPAAAPVPPSAPAVHPAAAPVHPAVPQQSAQIPFLIDDQSYSFDSVPPALQATLFTGQDIDFDLEEKPGENLFWRVVKYDPSVCRVEIDHERGGFWKHPKAEIEIKALRPGSTVIEFSAGAGPAAKLLRCTITVQ